MTYLLVSPNQCQILGYGFAGCVLSINVLKNVIEEFFSSFARRIAFVDINIELVIELRKSVFHLIRVRRDNLIDNLTGCLLSKIFYHINFPRNSLTTTEGRRRLRA